MREPSVQQTTVEDVYEDQLRRGAIVDASTPLADVVEMLDYQEALRAVYVVDARDRYVGVVTRSDLVGWIDHNLDQQGVFPWDEMAEAVPGTRAEDAVHPGSREIPVEPTEPVEHAMRSMLSAGVTVAPVVTAEGSIEGELTITRAMRHALEDG